MQENRVVFVFLKMCLSVSKLIKRRKRCNITQRRGMRLC